jgi:hypothetical protein
LKASFFATLTGSEREVFLNNPGKEKHFDFFQKTTDGLKEEGYGF